MVDGELVVDALDEGRKSRSLALHVFLGVLGGVFVIITGVVASLAVAYFQQVDVVDKLAEALGSVEGLVAAQQVIDDPTSTPAEVQAARDEARAIVEQIRDARRAAGAPPATRQPTTSASPGATTTATSAPPGAAPTSPPPAPPRSTTTRRPPPPTPPTVPPPVTVPPLPPVTSTVMPRTPVLPTSLPTIRVLRAQAEHTKRAAVRVFGVGAMGCLAGVILLLGLARRLA